MQKEKHFSEVLLHDNRLRVVGQLSHKEIKFLEVLSWVEFEANQIFYLSWVRFQVWPSQSTLPEAASSKKVLRISGTIRDWALTKNTRRKSP